jgi:hypothetical protein
MLTYTHIPSALNKYTIQHARVLSLKKILNRVRAKFQIFTRRVGNSFRNMCNSGKKNGLMIHSHNGSQSGTLEFFKKHVQPKIQKTNGSQSVASPSTTSSAAARGSVIFSLAFRSLAIFLSLYHRSFPALFLCTNYALHAKSNLIGQWHHDYSFLTKVCQLLLLGESEVTERKRAPSPSPRRRRFKVSHVLPTPLPCPLPLPISVPDGEPSWPARPLARGKGIRFGGHATVLSRRARWRASGGAVRRAGVLPERAGGEVGGPSRGGEDGNRRA